VIDGFLSDINDMCDSFVAFLGAGWSQHGFSYIGTTEIMWEEEAEPRKYSTVFRKN